MTLRTSSTFRGPEEADLRYIMQTYELEGKTAAARALNHAVRIAAQHLRAKPEAASPLTSSPSSGQPQPAPPPKPNLQITSSLHDRLRDHLSSPWQPPPDPSLDPAWFGHEILHHCRNFLSSNYNWSDWEQDFLESMIERLTRPYPPEDLTDKQVKSWTKICRKSGLIFNPATIPVRAETDPQPATHTSATAP
jgi:hypothetical protein